jgi:hypothetical protein
MLYINTEIIDIDVGRISKIRHLVKILRHHQNNKSRNNLTHYTVLHCVIKIIKLLDSTIYEN